PSSQCCASPVLGNCWTTSSDAEQSVLRITGLGELLDNEQWLQKAIRLRNPYVDPMNYIQVALLRRLRHTDDPDEAEALRSVILLSVNGIAAGLRNTG
ncbi:MAG: phosphoenolpyruvate carboxylase, partial [Anaerolineae bacterium]|nr:phosphoenolpyruvate carboxylase [Anaerolineae bacterium]